MYHSTTQAGRKGILRDGLKAGQSITSFRQSDDGGYTKAGVWADEYYGTHPVYLAIQQGLYSQLARQLGLEFEVEVDQNTLVADLPSLVDTGAYIEGGGMYWEYDDVPSAMKPVVDGDGWIAFKELLRPGSVAANAAIDTTGTAASLIDIPQERVVQLTSESILREYVRTLLKEGAKNIKDLESSGLYVTIKKLPLPKGNFAAAIHYSDANGGYGKDLIPEPIDGEITLIPSEAQGMACDDAWQIEYSEATQGWGPLLYDVAMEFATLNGGGLTPDRVSVSSDAKAVWDYYLSNRGNVASHQLDKQPEEERLPGPQLTPDIEVDDCKQASAAKDTGKDKWFESSLSKRYTKSPTTINALRAAGRLVEK